MPRKAAPVLSKFKLIAESKVPAKQLRRTSQEWLDLLKSVPKGQALMGSEKELGVGTSSVKLMVARLKKMRLLSDDYFVMQRTDGDTTNIFIVHPAKQTKARSAPNISPDQNVPSLNAFVAYIRSKGGNMEHTWEEVQEKVTGRKFKSDAKSQRTYRFVYSRYQYAKERIEKELGGKFKAENGVFRFQK